MKVSDVVLVGGGKMASEYLKVLLSLGHKPILGLRGGSDKRHVVHRLVEHNNLTCFDVSNLESRDRFLSHGNFNAIIAVSHKSSFSVTRDLINLGVRNILTEKPAAISIEEAAKYTSLLGKSNVHVAYNRRFFESTLALKTILKEETLKYFHFDFTERTTGMLSKGYPQEVLNNWFLINSSHVIDLAFHIAGDPEILNCHKFGGLDWHPKGSIFAGSGVTAKNAVFSYSSTWGSGGRWSLRFVTEKATYDMCPMETLRMTNLDGQSQTLVDEKEHELKPGLREQVKSFLSGSDVCTLSEYVSKLSFYRAILDGYDFRAIK